MAPLALRQGQGYAAKSSGPRAGFWRRFAAALVDGIILGLVYVILSALLKGAGVALGIIIAIAYYVALEGGPRGQTLGKQALGIRVIDVETRGPIGYGRAFIRLVGHWLSGIVFYIGYLWMLWDKEKQCWHDKLAGDVVVPVSAYPLP
ncbi:MAG: RDD family protein [Solirubrobacteraceae bacterium]